MDIRETREQKKARHTNKDFHRVLSERGQECRWSHFKKLTPAEEMLKLVRDRVFPHFKTIAVDRDKFGAYMKDAQIMT